MNFFIIAVSIALSLSALPCVLYSASHAPENEFFAESTTGDPNMQSFEIKEKRYVDLFDFPGEYPHLEKIDIDGRRKYRAELLLSGSYPKLESVHYCANIGELTAELKGDFPLLEKIAMTVGTVEMTLDVTGHIEKECDIEIKSRSGNITLIIPKGVGVTLHSNLGPKGKISLPKSFKKQGFGWFEKDYTNQLPDPKLHITFEGDSSRITLKEKTI